MVLNTNCIVVSARLCSVSYNIIVNELVGILSSYLYKGGRHPDRCSS